MGTLGIVAALVVAYLFTAISNPPHSRSDGTIITDKDNLMAQAYVAFSGEQYTCLKSALEA